MKNLFTVVITIIEIGGVFLVSAYFWGFLFQLGSSVVLNVFPAITDPIFFNSLVAFGDFVASIVTSIFFGSLIVGSNFS